MVAKAEIGGWLLFGMMARAGGTLFVDRSSRSSALAVTEQVAERLGGPIPVFFFPEGTSTDGSEVLRFHSRLFTPAVEAGAPVTAASIRYVAEDGTPEKDLCWFGDDAAAAHMSGRRSGCPVCSPRFISVSHRFTLTAVPQPTKPAMRLSLCVRGRWSAKRWRCCRRSRGVADGPCATELPSEMLPWSVAMRTTRAKARRLSWLLFLGLKRHAPSGR